MTERMCIFISYELLQNPPSVSELQSSCSTPEDRAPLTNRFKEAFSDMTVTRIALCYALGVSS